METPVKRKFSAAPGGILIHKKWQGTRLSDDLKVKFNKVSAVDLGPYDFGLSCDKFVIYIPESDLVTTVNADKFSGIDRNDTIIIAVRNTITAEQYSVLQDKLVITCNQKMIPVGSLCEVPDLLHQLSNFDNTPKKSPKEQYPSVHINILLNIPGLGKLKAEKLFDTFGTIHRIASSSVSELSSSLGLNLAAEVHKYFN